MRRASGFCVYDDPAIAIAWLLAAGAGTVAYVDIDVHHGDGVQAAFYDDPRVLTISLHESGRSLFPGTGFPNESGTGEAVGTSVNVALPAGTDDAGWLRAFDAVVPPLLRAFSPDVLLTQHGCDTHTARSTRAPDLHRRRPARRVLDVARAGPRSLWRPVGARSVVAVTSCCRWCRGPGPTCWTRR